MPRSRAFAAKFARLSGPNDVSSSTSTMSITGHSGSICGYSLSRCAQSCSTAMHTNRINFLDLHFDRLSFAEIKRRLQAVTSTSPYEYIVTPNVDHIVRVHREPALRE